MTTPDNNARSFESQDRVEAYEAIDGLTPAEEYLFRQWVPDESDVLDLGSGTGRTTPFLHSRARTYVGVDYSSAMVDRAQKRHPGVRFEVGDAAELQRFADDSFDVVVFSFNGLDYLSPLPRRHMALAEIRRVLRPDGTFLMSSHNPRALVRRATRGGSKARRVATSTFMTARAVKARAASGAVRAGSGYEVDHVQGLQTYFVTPEHLDLELMAHGFLPLERVGSEYPMPLHSWQTPWTYVAATPTPVDVTISEQVLPTEEDHVTRAWDALVSRVGGSPFQTRGWVESWAEFVKVNVTVLVAQREGEVVGLLPVARMTRNLHSSLRAPLEYLGIAGSGPGAADHLGPITSDIGIGALLFRRMNAVSDQTIFLESLAPEWASVAASAVGARQVSTTACPANVRAPGGKFSDAWSPKARKNARRRTRALEQAGISARWIAPGDGFRQALTKLRMLHDSRWQAQGEAGLFATDREILLESFAGRSAPNEGPRILLLEQGESAVAALFGIRFRDSFSVYKTGWDPEFASLGLGMALGQEAMRRAEQDDLHVFDYLRGGGAHKAELGCVPRLDVTLIAPRAASGQILAFREDPHHWLRLATRNLRNRVVRP